MEEVLGLPDDARDDPDFAMLNGRLNWTQLTSVQILLSDQSNQR